MLLYLDISPSFLSLLFTHYLDFLPVWLLASMSMPPCCYYDKKRRKSSCLSPQSPERDYGSRRACAILPVRSFGAVDAVY